MTPPSSSPSGFRIPMLGLAAIVVLAMAGGAMLMFAVMSATSITSAPSPTAPATVVAIVIPSVTPAPTQAPATDTPVPAATATPAPTSVPTEDTSQLLINLPANVRSGPGTNYPVIGGLDPGASAPVMGRDSTGTWYVIAYAEAVQGWVSNLVAEYRGDTQALPVIAAPPPPPTAVPPTAAPTVVPTAVKSPTPAVSGRGIVGTLTLCDPAKTTYGINERVCFKEKIVNTTNATINYGLFGVMAVSTSGGANQFQTSWFGNLAIDAGCTGPTDRCGGVWEDGSHITVAGTYSLQLRICYSALSQCQTGGEWETLTPGIAITIQ